MNQKKKHELVSMFIVMLLSVLFVTGCGKKELTWQEQYDLGMKYLQEAKYEEAVVAFSEVIKVEGKYLPAYTGIVSAYMGKEDYDNAFKMIGNGTEIASAYAKEHVQDYEAVKEFIRMIVKFADTIRSYDFEKLLSWVIQLTEIIDESDAESRELLYQLCETIIESWKNSVEEDGDVNQKDMIQFYEDLRKLFPEKEEEIQNQISNLKTSEDSSTEETSEEEAGVAEKSGLDDGDTLTEYMKLILLNGGTFEAGDEEHQVFMVNRWGDKGADTPYDIYNYSGKMILTGYEDAIWITKDGYARISFCLKGEEEEAPMEDIYGIALEEIPGDAYLERYDWEGNMLDRTQISGVGYQNILSTQKQYPKVDNTGINISITSEAVADGLLIKDANGEELGIIALDSPEEAVVLPHGSLVEIRQGFEVSKIYVVTKQ